MLHLIRYFRHKEFFFRSSVNRKRITKAGYCKDDSYSEPRGRAAAGEGKNYALSNPEFPILHDLAGLRTYPVWFLAVSCSSQ